MSSANFDDFAGSQIHGQADGVREGSAGGCRRDDVLSTTTRVYGIATQGEITRLASRTIIGEVNSTVSGSDCKVVYRDSLRGAREKKSIVSNGRASTPVGTCSPAAVSTAATPCNVGSMSGMAKNDECENNCDPCKNEAMRQMGGG